jgi:[citrate (pro-3S)-lyase] ligase
MDEYRVRVEVLHPLHPRDRKRTEEFLAARGLTPEGDVDLTVLVYYDDILSATASLAADVIKEVAVDPSLEGEGLAAYAVSRVITEAHALGLALLRVFTSPKNESVFSSLGFKRLAVSGADAILMESDPRAFDRWAKSAVAEANALFPADAVPRAPVVSGEGAYDVGAVVVNCNPFTRGHRSLIERAASRCGRLYVFVLQADKSYFPAAVRFDLVKKGTADLKNVAVVRSGPYIISEATFPTYFLKEKSRATEIHARLDLTLFAEKLCPAFGIRARFAGTEPYCAVTSLYNGMMRLVLPPLGTAFEELPRLETGGRAISASSVREALRTDDREALGSLLPETTIDYLRSPEAAPVIERIKAGSSRH